jgi:hypothetical protein
VVRLGREVDAGMRQAPPAFREGATGT